MLRRRWKTIIVGLLLTTLVAGCSSRVDNTSKKESNNSQDLNIEQGKTEDSEVSSIQPSVEENKEKDEIISTSEEDANTDANNVAKSDNLKETDKSNTGEESDANNTPTNDASKKSSKLTDTDNNDKSDKSDKDVDEKAESTDDDEVVVNTELSKDDIKMTDRLKAFKLAASRLTNDQINELMDMAKGGFTADEKAKAKELFYSNFTEEEREWILEMFNKYF